jgi:hypothetical protein
MFDTVNVAPLHNSTKLSASFSVANLFDASAFIIEVSSFGEPNPKIAVTLNAASVLKSIISRSLSTISLTATD